MRYSLNLAAVCALIIGANATFDTAAQAQGASRSLIAAPVQLLSPQEKQAFCTQLQAATSPAERAAIVVRMRETASSHANELQAGLLPPARPAQTIADAAAMIGECRAFAVH